jgi:hypothetical protein
MELKLTTLLGFSEIRVSFYLNAFGGLLGNSDGGWAEDKD